MDTLRHELFANGTTGTLLEYELGLKVPMVRLGTVMFSLCRCGIPPGGTVYMAAHMYQQVGLVRTINY